MSVTELEGVREHFELNTDFFFEEKVPFIRFSMESKDSLYFPLLIHFSFSLPSFWKPTQWAGLPYRRYTSLLLFALQKVILSSQNSASRIVNLFCFFSGKKNDNHVLKNYSCERRGKKCFETREIWVQILLCELFRFHKFLESYLSFTCNNTHITKIKVNYGQAVLLMYVGMYIDMKFHLCPNAFCVVPIYQNNLPYTILPGSV